MQPAPPCLTFYDRVGKSDSGSGGRRCHWAEWISPDAVPLFRQGLQGVGVSNETPEEGSAVGEAGCGEVRQAGGPSQVAPRKNAIKLRHLGWRPEMHGDLMEAQKAGPIVWVKDKWFAV